MEENVKIDMMTVCATASLIAMSHSGVVSDNYDSLYGLIVTSFNDDKFVQSLRGLKSGSKLTRSIRLTPENDAVCFASRLWFNVKRTASICRDGYYVGIGIDLKGSDMNVTGIRRLWIARIAMGDIDEIRKKVNAEGFREESGSRLVQHVYSACYDSVCNLMGKIPAQEKPEELPSAKSSMIEIDFGTARVSPVITVLQNNK